MKTVTIVSAKIGKQGRFVVGLENGENAWGKGIVLLELHIRHFNYDTTVETSNSHFTIFQIIQYGNLLYDNFSLPASLQIDWLIIQVGSGYPAC